MPNGPYVQVATFCEAVTRSERGNMTIEHCVTVLAAPMAPPPPAPGTVRATFIDHLVLALSLWSGELQGDYRISVRPEPPDGEILEPITEEIAFDGEGHGIDLEIAVPHPLTAAGHYWFSVLVSGGPDGEPERRITRVPLELRSA
jgi:hypothetical protein